MAKTSPTASRRMVLGALALTPAIAVPAVAATQISVPAYSGEWRRAHAEFRRCDLLHQADQGFGVMAKAEQNWEMEKCRIGDGLGGWDRARLLPEKVDEAKAAHAAIIEAEAKSCAHYFDPMNAAAIKLVLTPAPDFDAVQTKIDLIKRLALMHDPDMPIDAMVVISRDVERLMGGVA